MSESPDSSNGVAGCCLTPELALDAYAAAITGNHQRADESMALFEQRGLGSIPLYAMNWTLETVGVARLLARPWEEPLPSHWFADVPPDGSLLLTISSETLKILHALVCGEAVQRLRCRLTDTWAQFESGLAPGRVTRGFLEALDYAVQGDRSQELFGPFGMIVHQLPGSFNDPWADTVIRIGRFLHGPSEKVDELIAADPGGSSTPGLDRMILRCTILRRSHQLDPATLTRLAGSARCAGVEPEVLEVAESFTAEDPTARERALHRLRRTYPAYRVVEPSAESPERDPVTQMRHHRERILTDRERQVATLIIAGKSFSQTAEALAISVRTVQSHVRRLYRKLGVNSRIALRAELVAGLEVRP